MRRISLLPTVFLIGLIGWSTLVHGEVKGPYVGHMTETRSGSTEYHLSFIFGLEQWDNGKRFEEMNEKWMLQCHFPSMFSKVPNTYCSLERTRFWTLEDEVITRTLHFETIEGNLKIIKADWEKGALDLSLVEINKTTTEVKIRLGFSDPIEQHRSMNLSSFQAFTISRGELSDTMEIIEFKIAPYTYTLNVPVKMPGLRSEMQKIQDDLLATFSQEDQKAWEESQKEGNIQKKCEGLKESFTLGDEEWGKKLIPNWEKRKGELEKGEKLTAAEETLILNYFSERFAECLATSPLSAEAQKKLIETIRSIPIKTP